jgi:hypothetical protein
MKNSFLTVMMAVGLALAVEAGNGTAPTREQKAQAVAEDWLAQVDGGKYAESWDKMSAGFKKAVSKRKWISTVTEIRKPLGKVISRKLVSAEYTKDLRGAPEGEYMVLKFETSFEHKPGAVETVTPILEQDLQWRVSVYSVK